MSPLRLAAWTLALSACTNTPAATQTPTTGEATATPGTGADAGTPGDATAGGGGECRPTGCSATVCSDEDVMTTCEYKPEYACYKTAVCTRQPDGACGWTKTPELDACLANPPAE